MTLVKENELLAAIYAPPVYFLSLGLDDVLYWYKSVLNCLKIGGLSLDEQKQLHTYLNKYSHRVSELSKLRTQQILDK